MLTVSDNHIVLGGGGGGGGGGSSTFAGLSDKATADIPVINTPLATALSEKEAAANKKTDVDANKTSNTFFPTVKAVFDWVSGLFVKGAVSSTDNALVRWDGTTGKLIQGSTTTLADDGTLYVQKLTTVGAGTTFKPYTLSPYYPVFNGSGADVQLMLQRGTNRAVGMGASSTGALQFLTFGDSLPLSAEVILSVTVDGLTTCLSLMVTGNTTLSGQLIDNVGSSGTEGQVLKKVGGLVLWSNP